MAAAAAAALPVWTPAASAGGNPAYVSSVWTGVSGEALTIDPVTGTAFASGWGDVGDGWWNGGSYGYQMVSFDGLSDDATATRIGFTAEPSDSAVDSGLGLVLTVAGHRLTFYDEATHRSVTAELPDNLTGQRVAVDATRHIAYVSGFQDNDYYYDGWSPQDAEMTAWDLSTDTLLGGTGLDGYVADMTVAPDGSLVVADTWNDDVEQLTGWDGGDPWAQVENSWLQESGWYPQYLALDTVPSSDSEVPDTTIVVLSEGEVEGQRQVELLPLASPGDVTASVTLGQPGDSYSDGFYEQIAVDTTLHRAYVLNPQQDTLEGVDTLTGTYLGSLPTNGWPISVATNPATGLVLVSSGDEEEGEVQQLVRPRFFATQLDTPNVVQGTAATLTATLTQQEAGQVDPASTVSFSDDGSDALAGCDQVPLELQDDGSYVATCSTTAPVPGSYTVTATTTSSDGTSVVTSAGSSWTVTATQIASDVSLDCGSPQVGVPTACTATVVPDPADTAIAEAVPTGTVALSLADASAGTLSDDSCTLDGGTCSVDLTPASGTAGATPEVDAAYQGDDYYLGAETSATPTVVKVPTSVTVTQPDEATYGDTITWTATVTPSTAVGSVQFSAGGLPVGDPVPVVDGVATTPSMPATVGTQQVTAAFTGNADYADATTSTAASQIVDKAQPSLSVQRDGTHVSVSASSDAGTPTGTVTLSSGGTTIGQLTLDDGAASTTVAASTGVVDAVYSGDGDFAGATASTVPSRDPQVTVTLSGKHTASGWWRGPVTETFHCTDGSAEVASCPAPVTVTGDGVHDGRTVVVDAVDGGIGSVNVPSIGIDTTGPSISLSGVKNGGVYYGADPVAHYSATDALSGVAGYTSSVAVSGAEGAVRTLTVTATDHAGNVSKRSVTYTVHSVFIAGLTPVKGWLHVQAGHRYTVVAAVSGGKAPTYFWATPYRSSATTPWQHGPAMTRAANGTWTERIAITAAMRKASTRWVVGVRTPDGVMHLLDLVIS